MKTTLTDRSLRWLAGIIVVLYTVLFTTGVALQVATRSPLYGLAWLAVISEVVITLIFVLIGTLIVFRQPRHPVGWLWICISTTAAYDHFAWGYAYYGFIAHPGSLPGVGIMIVWMYLQVRATLGLFFITLLLLLFPTGRPPSHRWGWLAWISLGFVSLACLVSIISPAPFGYFPFPTDLIVSEPRSEIINLLQGISRVALNLCVLAAALSLLFRLRYARGVERQQIKWFVYSAVFLPIGNLIIGFGESLNTSAINGLWLLGLGVVLIGFVGISFASAIAIYRYRLWDIDIIIRRTLVYGLLTASLALAYLSSVVLLQGIFESLTGQASAIVVVISTLIIAALFSPLRRRIQNDIDRRFYRRRYDAEKIVATFSSSLREEVDIEQLSERLLGVVEETLEPESLSLWLKKQ